jgi:hypothetical protein
MDQSNPKNYLPTEHEHFARIGPYFEASTGDFSEKAYAFPRFVPRQAISYFLARLEAFKRILDVHGSILDFGVYRGASLFTWLQLSSLYEPYNHLRKVVGFDSFQGFSALSAHDIGAGGHDLPLKAERGMAYDGADELRAGIELHDLNRPLGHVPKASIVEGALPDSLAAYLEEHPETIVALANFGLGLYEPTRALLALLKPRLVRGSVLLFEDLNQATWPGETRALFEVFDPSTIRLSRVPFCPHLCWAEVV